MGTSGPVLSSTQSHMTNRAVVFDRVLLNDGQGYNNYTGAFTAPLSGVYQFSFFFDSHTLSFLQLVVDGVNQVDAIANRHTVSQEGQQAHSMGGNTCIVRLNHGEAVMVRAAAIPNAEVASASAK